MRYYDINCKNNILLLIKFERVKYIYIYLYHFCGLDDIIQHRIK